MPLRFLLWNLARRPLAPQAAALASEHSAHVVILVESDFSPVLFLQSANSIDPAQPALYNFAPTLGPTKIQVFTSFAPNFVRPVSDESSRLSLREILLPGLPSLLLGALHLPDKRNNDALDQTSYAIHAASLVRRAEQSVGHRRTLLLGDFNMHPFDDGMTSVLGFNAVREIPVAQRQQRTHNNLSHPYFYNPMWALFGDRSGQPPGTYYHASPRSRSLHWCLLDQVLLRPDLLPYFSPGQPLILTSVAGRSLLRKDSGYPDEKNFSDHLPLLVELNL